jgi:four helix bundle protein
MIDDDRGKEIARQLIRSAGSIPANIEEGYGRGLGKEFAYFLRISRGSARETKGWYKRSKRLLDPDIVYERMNEIDEVISLLVSMINTLENKEK